jgi:hypothetical protein
VPSRRLDKSQNEQKIKERNASHQGQSAACTAGSINEELNKVSCIKSGCKNNASNPDAKINSRRLQQHDLAFTGVNI